MPRRSLALLAVACGSHAPAPEHPAAGARLGPAVAAAITAAELVREPWRCAADSPPLADETLVGWQLGGHALRRTGAATATTIAVIADAGGDAHATIAMLGKLRGKLASADLVLALGGMGASSGQLAAVFGALTGAAPIVVLAGDLEPAEAVAGLPRPMVDARRVRRIELPGATIITLPGAGAKARLVAGDDGCTYRPEDLAAALADLAPRSGLRVLAAAEGPRALRDGEPTGELTVGDQLDLVLASGELSPAQSGKRGTVNASPGGAEPIALSPGSSDATARIPAMRPSAALLTVRDGAWSWAPVFP